MVQEVHYLWHKISSTFTRHDDPVQDFRFSFLKFTSRSIISGQIAGVLVTLSTMLSVIQLNMDDASQYEWQSHGIHNGVVSWFGVFEGLGGFSVREVSE